MGGVIPVLFIIKKGYGSQGVTEDYAAQMLAVPCKGDFIEIKDGQYTVQDIFYNISRRKNIEIVIHLR